jgi:hypothetical protein
MPVLFYFIFCQNEDFIYSKYAIGIRVEEVLLCGVHAPIVLPSDWNATVVDCFDMVWEGSTTLMKCFTLLKLFFYIVSEDVFIEYKFAFRLEIIGSGSPTGDLIV